MSSHLTNDYLARDVRERGYITYNFVYMRLCIMAYFAVCIILRLPPILAVLSVTGCKVVAE